MGLRERLPENLESPIPAGGTSVPLVRFGVSPKHPVPEKSILAGRQNGPAGRRFHLRFALALKLKGGYKAVRHGHPFMKDNERPSEEPGQRWSWKITLTIACAIVGAILVLYLFHAL